MGARGFLGKRKRGLERTCRGAALGLGGPEVVTRREQAVRGGALPWRRRSGENWRGQRGWEVSLGEGKASELLELDRAGVEGWVHGRDGEQRRTWQPVAMDVEVGASWGLFIAIGG